MGHLQSAPERLVPGCKFWSSGAPTSNLFFFFWKNKKKKRIKVKWKPWGGSYIIRIWQSLHCAQFYVNIRMYPSIHRGATRKKKKAHAWKGKVWIITLADKHTSAKKKKKKNRKKDCHRSSLFGQRAHNDFKYRPITKYYAKHTIGETSGNFSSAKYDDDSSTANADKSKSVNGILSLSTCCGVHPICHDHNVKDIKRDAHNGSQGREWIR